MTSIASARIALVFAALTAAHAHRPARAGSLATGEVATRPTGLSFGLGAGYRIPTWTMNLTLPDLTSLRLRWPSGFTLEPQLALGRWRNAYEVDGTEHNDSWLSGHGGLAVRFPVARRGATELVVAGHALLGMYRFHSGYGELEGEAEGDSIWVQGGWGLGIERWLDPRVCLGVTTSNRLIEYSRSGYGSGPPYSSLSLALDLTPRLDVMLHGFF
jgi:hypothetical protein